MKALLVIDFINEIVNPEGKLAGKGYAENIAERNVLGELSKVISDYKSRGITVIYSGLSFEKDYVDKPKNSLLLGKADEFGILESGSWGVNFLENLPNPTVYFTKNRISAFSNPALDAYLKSKGIDALEIAGVSTDLAVQSAARDAHDLDYKVSILSGCCAAANNEDHNEALRNLQKFTYLI